MTTATLTPKQKREVQLMLSTRRTLRSEKRMKPSIKAYMNERDASYIKSLAGAVRKSPSTSLPGIFKKKLSISTDHPKTPLTNKLDALSSEI